ncbi:unnamed protein product [Clonostachys rosea]|uniref:AAA+ ATPase domain-containing protein n=1 Tax=Bionectria ochroleuca TaxID=29856 RepID=A0ABY6U473_BIOOC|nr:unnamed protein product [Clonostachys rosea]
MGSPLPDRRSTLQHWARQYETNDPKFRVSWLLGLRPALRRTRRRGPRLRKSVEGAEGSAESQEESPSDEESADDASGKYDMFVGVAMMFGDEPYEEESSEEEETQDEAPAQTDQDPPVLATPEFLELCTQMEDLLAELEQSSAEDDDDNESIDGLFPEDREDESVSRKEWLRQKTVEKAENKYLDRIMSLPGLEDVKAMFLHAKAKIQASTRRETCLKKENFDVCFTGGQGTGKSTCATLYAKFLVSIGLFKPPAGNTGIHKASSYYFAKTSTLESMRQISSTCGGCIVVLDDAHLIDKDDYNLWSFFTRAKELPGTIVIVLAGDAEAGLTDQLTHRAVVEHHFPVYKLPNYSEDLLRSIFHGMVRKWFNKKMKLAGEVDDLYVKILVRRILRGTSEKSFANIWPLKKAFIEACRRQVERFHHARREGLYLEDYFLNKEDLLGKPPCLKPEKSPAWKELQGLLGLENVKQSILSVVHQVNQNYEREMKGLEPLYASANRVFLGSPGTGKTTVAKLYGKILADFGLLSKGDVIVKNPSDLIDRYIGGSEQNTKEALAEAKGSVLIIDDAHMLDPGKRSTGSKNGDFRGAILDTLVAEVTGAPGEDRCVILCGYSAHMKEMYANCNPGFARRFPLDTAFVFEDFDIDTLGKIFDYRLEKEKLVATEKARKVAMDMLSRASVRPNFGNGGEVVNLISKAIMARTKRMADNMNFEDIKEQTADTSDKKANGEDKKVDQTEKSSNADEPIKAGLDETPLLPEDFDPDWDRNTRAVANTRALFEGFIGYEEIISKFESYQYMAQGMRLRGIDPRPYIPFTYVFKGPPGTGKTSTSRKLGQIFYDMGLLAAPDVVEVSASQLIGEYCGQTAPKTERLLESALGKVLFIDEAYRLASSSGYAEEAVSELVDAVTKPKYSRKLIIVLAGYEEDMDRLMRFNPGMKSRFATEFTFKPLRAEQCLEQLRAVVGKVGITIQNTREMDSATRGNLMGTLSRLNGEKGWASGRSVETLGEKLIAHIFKECAMKGYTGDELTVTGKELITILFGSVIARHGAARFNSGPMGARQIKTLKDLEGYE